MHKIESHLVETIIINILLFAIPFIYYSPKFIPASSIGSIAFVDSTFGTSYFPGSFMQFWMELMGHFNVSLYYNYLSLAIVSLYLSILGSYVFLSNIVTFVQGQKVDGEVPEFDRFLRSVLILLASLVMVMNPFFASNYSLGVNFLPFLMLSLAVSSEAIKFPILDKRFISLLFLAGFLLYFGYGGYILLPFYFAIIFLVIAVPASYKIAPLHRTFVVITFSLLLFLLSSGVLSFLRDSLSGTLGGLFPYFRPLNLTHEYALLSTSSLMQAYSGLSFNIGFTSSTLSLLESTIILILVLIILMTAILYIVLARRKLIILLLELIVVIILSVPYANNIPIIGYLPLYIISSHTFTYIHYGEILSVFDANRLLLFIYWSVFSALIAVGAVFLVSSVNLLKLSGSLSKNNFPRRLKVLTTTVLPIVAILVILLASYSTVIGAYNSLSFDTNSPTYAYASHGNISYDRMLLFQNENSFYPGNFYPGYMQTQADIPDKPMYVNFVNLESSPIVKAGLDSLPPASFVYNNGSENFIDGGKLSDGYNFISNSNENVTVGYPVFVLGSQYTFDQYIFKNYYTELNTTHIESYVNASINYGRFAYYSLPHEYLSYLNHTGGLIELNLNVKILKNIQNGTAYTFGFSNASQYYPLGTNELSVGIGVFNQSSSSVLFGSGNPIIRDFNSTEYLSTSSYSTSYNLENYIPFDGNSTGNISFVFFNSGKNGIYGFIDYGGQWYQSLTNYSISDLIYFYSQAYLDQPSGISYNFTVSDLQINPNYKNVIPIYYDSPFGNLDAFIEAVRHTDLIIRGKNFPLSDLVGSLMDFSSNSTVINPSAYSISMPENGWYQVFADGAAQSSYSGEYIPPVIDQPVFGYSAYDGFAQSIIENSSFTVPTGMTSPGLHSLEMNLLFSPVGGNLIIDAGGSRYIVNTIANNSYYGWINLNVSGPFSKLGIVDKTGVQSINQIVLSPVSTHNYFVRLAESILSIGHSQVLSELPQLNVTSSSFNTKPVMYSATISLNYTPKSLSIMMEYSNPTYSGFKVSSTSSTSFIVPAWASFPAIIVYNLTTNKPNVKYYETNSSYYSGFLPYVEIQGAWIPMVSSFVISRKKKIKGT